MLGRWTDFSDMTVVLYKSTKTIKMIVCDNLCGATFHKHSRNNDKFINPETKHAEMIHINSLQFSRIWIATKHSPDDHQQVLNREELRTAEDFSHVSSTICPSSSLICQSTLPTLLPTLSLRPGCLGLVQLFSLCQNVLHFHVYVHVFTFRVSRL